MFLRPFLLKTALFNLLWLVVCTSASACSVPVFRYAIDRWAPDSYRLRVPAGKVLPEAAQQVLEGANCRIVPGEANESMAILAPETIGDVVVFNKVTPEKLSAILSSRARVRIAENLASGDNAVFLMLGDTESKAFHEARERLDEFVKELPDLFSLPIISAMDRANYMGPGPELRIGGSVVTMDINAPDEAAFRALLKLGDETVVGDESSEIFVYPIFGRGRVLAKIAFEPGSERVLASATQFLTGPCSCQVKGLNPGWDLLFRFDWDAALAEAGKP
ncbi:MAG: hypothetical protein ACFB21_08680 [Opitutales bacterium]